MLISPRDPASAQQENAQSYLQPTKAQSARGRARMLLDVEDLQKYMRDAFDVFSKSLGSPFDFITASLRSQITVGFGENTSRLLRCMVDIWKEDLATARPVLHELRWVISSGIMLESVRRREKGEFPPSTA